MSAVVCFAVPFSLSLLLPHFLTRPFQLFFENATLFRRHSQPPLSRVSAFRYQSTDRRQLSQIYPSQKQKKQIGRVPSIRPVDFPTQLTSHVSQRSHEDNRRSHLSRPHTHHIHTDQPAHPRRFIAKDQPRSSIAQNGSESRLVFYYAIVIFCYFCYLFSLYCQPSCSYCLLLLWLYAAITLFLCSFYATSHLTSPSRTLRKVAILRKASFSLSSPSLPSHPMPSPSPDSSTFHDFVVRRHGAGTLAGASARVVGASLPV